MDERTARSRHSDSMRQAFLSALIPMLVQFLIAPAVGEAQVETSITSTIGAGDLGTHVTPPHNNIYDITGGARPGDGPNLFHSFGDFTVGAGDTANFLNTTPNITTTNILGRVTGGNPSSLFGTIDTMSYPGANLFLVNPSGILFGPTASLSVGGSVSFTTAQYIRLFDGLNSANFYADTVSDGLANSVLAVAPVGDFGFLNAAPAAYGFLDAPNPLATITVQGSALSVPSGQSISLIGGKVIIESGTPDGGPAQLSAPTGRIQLATAASPGEFDLTLQSLPNNPVDTASAVSFTSFGSVSLAPSSSIDVSGASTVFVKGGQLVLSVKDAILTTAESAGLPDTISLGPGSSMWTSNSGAGPGADVQVTVGNLQMDSSLVVTINSGGGDGGNISINATEVGLTNEAAAIVSFNGSGSGHGGNITADVGTLSLTIGATIQTLNFSPGLGQGGDVTIQGPPGAPNSPAESVTLSDLAKINTTTASDFGSGGKVSITANTLTIQNAAQVSTDTLSGAGVGGNLSLNVGTLTLTSGPLGESSIQSSNFSPGTDLDLDGVPDVFKAVGGNVTIQGIHGVGSPADLVILSGGSRIKSETIVGGDGGRVSVAATSLNLDEASTIESATFGVGLGGGIVVSAKDTTLSGGATIASRTFLSDPVPGQVPGTGGTITVQGLPVPEPGEKPSKADSLTLEGSRSGIISETFGQGTPGDIAVHAKTVGLTDGAVIEAGNPQSTGTGGKVTINAVSVSITDRSHIVSQASGRDAGEVTITADQLTLDNGSIATSTVPGTPGLGGDVVLNVGSVSLANGATINSSTSGTGLAGNITMTIGSLSLTGNSAIKSISDGTTVDAGDAGSVTITASGAFTSNASTIATSAENAKGGDILIDAQSVQLSNGTLISASSNAPLLPEGGGDAGNVTINSASNVIMQNSSVTTEASQASGGQITLNAADSGMIRMIDSRVVTSVAGSGTDTNGGDITIDPQFVILQNSQILAQAVAGAGGNINIISNVFLADPNSLVDASSQLGISGTVNIQAPVQNVSGDLVVLSQDFSSAAALLAQQCAARVADGKFSTFVVAAREGLPVEPGGFLPGPSFLTELGGQVLSGRPPQTPRSAVAGSLPEYSARPLQLAKLGNACHR